MTNDVKNRPCPACGAQPGRPCRIQIEGVDTTGWDHDARILAPIVTAIRTRVLPPEGG